MGTTISSGPLHTSGSLSCSLSCSRWHPATYTSHTSSSSTPTTLISCGGRRRLTQTGTLRKTHTRVVTSVTSSLPQDRACRRRWDLLLRQGDLRSKMGDQGPRRYDPPAEPICQPASGRRTADLILRSKKGDRPCAGYRVIYLRPDRSRRGYFMDRGPQQNRKYRSPVYGRPS